MGERGSVGVGIGTTLAVVEPRFAMMPSPLKVQMPGVPGFHVT
jgi:hypothetical protein